MTARSLIEIGMQKSHWLLSVFWKGQEAFFNNLPGESWRLQVDPERKTSFNQVNLYLAECFKVVHE